MTQRRVLTAVTLLILCGILAVFTLVGWSSLFAPIHKQPSASPSTCTTEQINAGSTVKSTEVTLSVYNAGSRAGLADETMRSLVKRGFVGGSVGNAPSTATVSSVEVWTTTRHDAAAHLVALQFGVGTKVVVTDQDLGPGIDVIVGNKLKGLVNAPTSVTVKRTVQVCQTPASG